MNLNTFIVKVKKYYGYIGETADHAWKLLNLVKIKQIFKQNLISFPDAILTWNLQIKILFFPNSYCTIKFSLLWFSNYFCRFLTVLHAQKEGMACISHRSEICLLKMLGFEKKKKMSLCLKVFGLPRVILRFYQIQGYRRLSICRIICGEKL